jgi:phage-related protein (TIGR01555 family)
MEGLLSGNTVEINNDGWSNVISGLGTMRDRRENTSFTSDTVLADQTLMNIWESEGIGAQIINIPAEDMVTKWFYIEADTDNRVVKALQKIGAKKAIESALKWARLFGASIIIMRIDDGGALDTPVNIDKIKKIESLDVYDKRDLMIMPENIYTNTRDSKYGKPKLYTVNNMTTGEMFTVHESRVLRFDGIELPITEKIRNNGWGGSVLNRVYTRLRGLGESLAGVEHINSEFIMNVLKLKNLQTLLSSKEGSNSLYNRIQIMDMVKGLMNTTVIDANEEFERVTSVGVSGLRELIDVLIDVVCGISEVPRIKLIGDQSKGLGGESAGTLRLYYDRIAHKQETELQTELDKLCMYIKNIVADDLKDLDVTCKFKPLYQMSDKEEAEIKLLNAKADGVYIQSGAPMEFFLKSRFGGQSYGNNVVLPPEYVKVLEGLSAEKLYKEAKEKQEKPAGVNMAAKGEEGKNNE